MDELRDKMKKRKAASLIEAKKVPVTKVESEVKALPSKDMTTAERYASLQRHRYQPMIDHRISKLPLYLSEEIKTLREIAAAEGWSLDVTSYANNQDAPLYSGNTFYEYMDESHEYLVDFLVIDIKDMPLYINDKSPWKRTLSKWRLTIGK